MIIKSNDCFEVEGKITLFYTVFLKILSEYMKVTHNFPAISM